MPYPFGVADGQHDRRSAECTDIYGYSYDVMKPNQDAETVPKKGSNVLGISSVYNGRLSMKLLFQPSLLSPRILLNLSLPRPHLLSHPRKSHRRMMFTMPGLLPKHLLLRHRPQTIQRHHRLQHPSRQRLYPLHPYTHPGLPRKNMMTYTPQYLQLHDILTTTVPTPNPARP